MQRCRLGCPPDVRPLLDDLIKKRVKSLIDSVGGVPRGWTGRTRTRRSRSGASVARSRSASRCARSKRAEASAPAGAPLRANGAGDASASFGAFSSLVDVTPSVLFQPPAFFASRVERHIRDLIRENEARKGTNVARFLANVALGEDGIKKNKTGAGANVTNAKPSSFASRDLARCGVDTAYLCASSVLRRAPEAAVNFLRSNGHEEWACRLHVLLWGSPFPDAGETFEDFERSDVIESRYKSDAAMAWLTENAYTRMGFTREDADAFELEGIARRASGVDVEAASLRDAYMLGLPRNLLETTVARAGGTCSGGRRRARARRRELDVSGRTKRSRYDCDCDDETNARIETHHLTRPPREIRSLRIGTLRFKSAPPRACLSRLLLAIGPRGFVPRVSKRAHPQRRLRAPHALFALSSIAANFVTSARRRPRSRCSPPRRRRELSRFTAARGFSSGSATRAPPRAPSRRLPWLFSGSRPALRRGRA